MAVRRAKFGSRNPFLKGFGRLRVFKIRRSTIQWRPAFKNISLKLFVKWIRVRYRVVLYMRLPVRTYVVVLEGPWSSRSFKRNGYGGHLSAPAFRLHDENGMFRCAFHAPSVRQLNPCTICAFECHLLYFAPTPCPC